MDPMAYGVLPVFLGKATRLIEYTDEFDKTYVAECKLILLKAEADDITRVSLRSKGIDVNVVASHFGGGGHIRAAGCTINLPLEEAKQALIEVIN